MNAFQKNFLFAVVVSIGTGTVILGGNAAINAVKAHRAAARAADMKLRVERVMKLNICAHFTEGEQARLDKVQGDPWETKKVLLKIHQDRAETWQANMKSEHEAFQRYQDLDRRSSYVSYGFEMKKALRDAIEAGETADHFMEAVQKIHNHDPSLPVEAEKPKSGQASAPSQPPKA